MTTALLVNHYVRIISIITDIYHIFDEKLPHDDFWSRVTIRHVLMLCWERWAEMAQNKQSPFAGLLLLGSAVMATVAAFGRDFLTGVGAELAADAIQERAAGSVLTDWADALLTSASGPVLWIGVSVGLTIALYIVVKLRK